MRRPVIINCERGKKSTPHTTLTERNNATPKRTLSLLSQIRDGFITNVTFLSLSFCMLGFLVKKYLLKTLDFLKIDSIFALFFDQENLIYCKSGIFYAENTGCQISVATIAKYWFSWSRMRKGSLSYFNKFNNFNSSTK